MDFLLKYLGKHEIGEYVDEPVRKHVGSPHTGGSHYYDEFTNGLHDNLGKMNLGSSCSTSHEVTCNRRPSVQPRCSVSTC